MEWAQWKSRVYLFFVIILAIVSVFIVYDFKSQSMRIKLGLDLRSGSHIAIQLISRIDPATGKRREIDERMMDVSRGIFERRLNPDGNREIIIQTQGRDRMIVEIPEETDVKKAEDLIKRTGVLEFKEQYYDPAKKTMEWRTVLDGSYLKKDGASVDFDSVGNPHVSFRLTKEGAKEFAKITERNVGKPLAIFFDGKLTDQPTVREPITGGDGMISGGKMGVEECHRLAVLLNAGALPVDVNILESMTVSPTLGRESLIRSLVAGFIGLTLVILFMIWYYRIPGFLADLALVVYTVLLLATMVIFNFVLTLPGIAGLILSIGMAVDANVLIFERLKEELWAEKSLRNAIDTGFRRAFSSILDSHVTTFIGALILFVFGASSIKGFGLTLMLGTFWSIITAVVFTKVFMDFVADSNLVLDRKLYGE